MINQMRTKEDELQKAIDNITNNHSNNINPSFSSNNVKTPNTNNSGNPMGAIDLTASTAPKPNFGAPATPPVAPFPNPPAAPVPPEPKDKIAKNSENSSPKEASEAKMPTDPNIQQVKEKALKDLAPLLGTMNINAEQKFRIYQDILKTLGDKSVLEDAYNTIAIIEDDNKRAEALLEIVNFIDDMEN